MSFNGAGQFQINTSGQPVVTGTVISSTVFNALTADLATGLSTCITKDGQTTVTANIPMNSFKFTGLAAGTAATDSARLGQVQAGTATVVTVTGTDTYVGTMSPPLTAYAAGNMFTFVVPNTNTTSCTLNIDSVGAKALTRDGSTALVAGDLVANSEVVVVYDGTRFQVLNSNSKTNFNLSGNFTVAGSLTASGGTANGVLYLNGSKVATSGSALTFDGTNLGIGTTSPSTFGTLAVVGTRAYIAGGASSTEQLRLGYTDGTSYWGMGRDNATTGNFTINNAGSTKVTLDTSGNLGLGVVPSAWNASSKAFQYGSNGIAALECFNGANSVMMFNMYRASGGYVYTVAGNNGYRFGIDNSTGFAWTICTGNQGAGNTPTTTTQAMTLDASGNLGLGTSSPNTAAGYIQQTVNGTSGSAVNLQVSATDTAQVLAQANLARFIAKGASTVLTLETNGAERARIDSSGNLLVGTTSSAKGTIGSIINAGQTQENIRLNSTGASQTWITFNISGSTTGSITYGSSVTAYNTTSDYRLKELIAPVSGSGARLDALKPVEYEWKADGSHARGFFAHEFQSVYPGSVTGEKDAVDQDGNPIYQSMQASTSEVMADLVAEIKSLRARVAQLEAR